MTNTCGTDRERVAANLRRIAALLDPPPPAFKDRLRSARYAARDWLSRHVTHRELYRRIDAVQELLEMKRRRDGSPRTTEPLGRYRHELSGVVRDLDDGLI